MHERDCVLQLSKTNNNKQPTTNHQPTNKQQTTTKLFTVLELSRQTLNLGQFYLLLKNRCKNQYPSFVIGSTTSCWTMKNLQVYQIHLTNL